MPDDYFDGAVGISGRENIPRDGIDEPDRDVDAVTDTLNAVEPGDWVQLGIAVDHPETGRTGGTSVMQVLSVETGVMDFDRRINLLHHDGEVHRLWITTIGSDEFDPWEIVSAPYVPEVGLLDLRDLSFHGWVVGAKVVDGGER